MCQPCPRTPVNHVSGLYSKEGLGEVEIEAVVQETNSRIPANAVSQLLP